MLIRLIQRLRIAGQTLGGRALRPPPPLQTGVALAQEVCVLATPARADRAHREAAGAKE
jgi:hypothetical protein